MVWDRHSDLGDEGSVSHPALSRPRLAETPEEILAPIKPPSDPAVSSCFHEQTGDRDTDDEPNPERPTIPEPCSEPERSGDTPASYEVIDDPDEWDADSEADDDDEDIDDDDVFEDDPDDADDDDFDDDLDDDFDDE